MPDVDYGALALQVLGKRLRDEADGQLRRELTAAIRDEVRPVLATIRVGLPDFMPDRYAAELEADLILKVITRTTGASGVRVYAPERVRGRVFRRRLNRLEHGVLAHPLFGNRKRWFNQTDGVIPGFFSRPLEEAQPRIRQAIVDLMADTAKRLTRKA